LIDLGFPFRDLMKILDSIQAVGFKPPHIRIIICCANPSASTPSARIRGFAGANNVGTGLEPNS
jgi:hypothetical protein